VCAFEFNNDQTGLNLEQAGVKYSKRDGVLVNDWLQSSNTNVYAAGEYVRWLSMPQMISLR
jgi:pyruvate/2-oxoglutarate dehydrogenase complex dihydrolipoamide dehydrogenase (E3) component